MKALKKYKALLLCFMSLFFMAGMCEEDPDVDVVLVKGIELDYTKAELKVGETLTLSAIVTPKEASNSSLIWKSSDESVATVDAAKITAVSQGSAIITATAKDGSGVTATCLITVAPKVIKVESVDLDPERISLAIGETKNISAKVLPENADNKELQWKSDDERVACIQNGMVTAVAEGVALITATAMDGGKVNGTCLVIVEAESSENPDNPNNPDDSDAILVKSISLSHSDVSLYVGESVTISAAVLPENAENKVLAWESRDANVANVENGKITAVSVGNTLVIVKATDGSGVKEYCMVTVLSTETPDEPNNPDDPSNPDNPDPGTEPEPDEDVVLVTQITLNKETATLNVGEELELTASIYPQEATEKTLTWTTNNPSIASVQDGLVVANNPGQAIIKAIAKDGSGVNASCVVTVSENVYSPVAAKNKMESVGVSFVNAIKADAHQNLVELMDYSVVTFEDFDIDEAYYEKLMTLVEGSDAEEYARGVNPVRAMMGMTGLCLDIAKTGAQLSNRAAYVYTLAVKAGLSDLYGKFTPDYANEVWQWNSSVKDRVEVAFTDADGQQWVATLKGSAGTTRIHVTAYSKVVDGGEIYIGGPYDGQTNDWSNGDTDISNVEYVIDVPETLAFAVTCNGRTVISLDLDSSLAFNLNYEEDGVSTFVWRYDGGDEYSDSYVGTYEFEGVRNLEISYENLNLDATLLVNGYEETFKTDISKKGVAASAGIKIDGRSMLSADASIKANMDALIADVNDEFFKAGNIDNFSMNFDVLNEIQFDVACTNFKNLYDALQYLAEAEDVEQANSWLDKVNGAYSAKLRFDNTATTQATFELEAKEESGEWEGTYVYFRPVMVFASNGSRHSIEDYFTESAFSDLIKAVEKLAEQFESLYGDYFEEEEEDYYPYH